MSFVHSAAMVEYLCIYGEKDAGGCFFIWFVDLEFGLIAVRAGVLLDRRELNCNTIKLTLKIS